MTAQFLDDAPSWKYGAVLPYWLGRAQQGLKMNATAAESFDRYLRIRSRGCRSVRR
ncbi:MAG TPA: hypothetical protein VLD67_18965 [Vicinamibacterales bacterium]|nr:hypothetical protein [Vicinamibacterales bacterium]